MGRKKILDKATSASASSVKEIKDKEKTESTSMAKPMRVVEPKNPSPFEQAFLNFLNNDGGNVGNPVQSPLPNSSEPGPAQLPGKKKYIPPYTPERTPVKPPSPVKSIILAEKSASDLL